MDYIYHGKTDIGIERKVNQDCFGTVKTDWGSIFIISDGFGHQEGGKFASQSTVEIFKKNFSKQKPSNINEFYRDTFDEVNKHIYFTKVSKYDNAMMGCTALILIVKGDIARIAYIGDSRAYLVKNTKIKVLTKDHSYVQSLIDKGELSEEKAMFHSRRHVLTRALGSKRGVKPDYKYQPIFNGDTFMTCSDGLWGFASQKAILETILNSDPKNATTELIDLVKRNSGSDNITLQIISFI